MVACDRGSITSIPGRIPMANENVFYSLPQGQSLDVVKALTAIGFESADAFKTGIDQVDQKRIFTRRDATLMVGTIFAIHTVGRVEGKSSMFGDGDVSYNAATVVLADKAVAILGLDNLVNPAPKADVRKVANPSEYLFTDTDRETVEAYHAKAQELGSKALNYGPAYEKMPLAERLKIFSEPLKVLHTFTLEAIPGGPRGSFKRTLYIFGRPTAAEKTKWEESQKA